jgi:hypothetical protein
MQVSRLAEDLDLLMELSPSPGLAELRAAVVARPPDVWPAPMEYKPLRLDAFTPEQIQRMEQQRRRWSKRATFADVYAD